MAYEYLTMVTSFITFFMIGVTLSIHPASIMVGTNTYIESQSKWTRWNGYIIFVLLLFVMDLFLTNAVYLAFYDIYGNLSSVDYLNFDFMDVFFSESFQIVVVVLFLLVLFQVLGLVDVAHGERNLSFYYSQVESGKEPPSWMERYMERGKGSLGASIIGYLYMLWMTKRSLWTYIVCVVWFKVLAMLVNVLVSPVINRIMHTNNELATHVILDPYIISYVLAGFLWGHVALHHDLSEAYRLAKSVVISLVPRLSVLVGAVLFIGLSLAIIFVPITWDVVVDVLTSK
ncbi:MAG: hypothetical protein E6Z43_08700 [Veillonella sp.]|uniref:hypothetical protein n=1 Tax=Veillonella sp. TaxID=1926307 RepID=UPI0029113489|nr:hypothetical protein [Veillonella sp.]MDU5866679.1 hypothetical protein [Veillonella sp.]